MKSNKDKFALHKIISKHCRRDNINQLTLIFILVIFIAFVIFIDLGILSLFNADPLVSVRHQISFVQRILGSIPYFIVAFAFALWLRHLWKK